ncbi:MAG: bifunctional riboflavin kinase/FAD synthetase [Flavobacteriaceae bacterium]|nr:bifunctional riboflavin kinase/FAD synthetase [Flavobacteriaceae bacterium]
MRVYKHLDQYHSDKKSVLTIGTFDGVHIGHQKILKQVVSMAKNFKHQSIVLSFFPHPRMILHPDSHIKLIDTVEEKIEKIKALGIDHLIIHPFSKEFSLFTAEQFVSEILVNKLNLERVIIGYNHRFGRNRQANIDALFEFGEKFNFQVDVIPRQEIEDISVSSTKIRQALKIGKIDTANAYLKTLYSIHGIVIEGDSLGRTIGFPTANIRIKENYKLLPKPGVYFVTCLVDNTSFFGMLNIGSRPTINELEKNSIEVHLFDFDQSIYGNHLSIQFNHRIRNQIKFENLSALKGQLQKDKLQCLDLIHHMD